MCDSIIADTPLLCPSVEVILDMKSWFAFFSRIGFHLFSWETNPLLNCPAARASVRFVTSVASAEGRRPGCWVSKQVEVILQVQSDPVKPDQTIFSKMRSKHLSRVCRACQALSDFTRVTSPPESRSRRSLLASLVASRVPSPPCPAPCSASCGKSPRRRCSSSGTPERKRVPG